MEEQVIDIETEQEEKKQDSKARVLWKRFKNSFLGRTLKIVLFLTILAVLGASYAVIEKKSDPAVVANEFLGGLISGNVESVYQSLLQTDEAGLQVEILAEALNEVPQYGKIGQAELGDYEKKDGKIVYHVTYDNVETGEEETFDIWLEQKNPSFFKLIKTWRVDFSDYIVENTSVTIPRGCDLYVDDAKVVSAQDEEDYKTITISGLYKGTHTFSLRSPYTKDGADVREIQEDDSTISYEDTVLEVREDVAESIQEMHVNALTALYESASVYQSVKKATKDLITGDDTVQAQVQEAYKAMRKQLYGKVMDERKEYSVESLTLDEVEIADSKVTDGKNGSLRFDTVMKFKTSRNTSYTDGYAYSVTGTYKVCVRYDFTIKQDGTYTITNVKFSMKKQK